MKKIFTLMWAIVCAALTIVSCTPDNGDDNNGGVTYTSKIIVTGAPEANLTPAAGELSLGYAIENATLTDALTVTTEATWVHVGEIGEATVALTYDANTDAPGSPAREAVIKFAYNGAEDVLVTLKQDTASSTFTVTFDEATLTCGYAAYTWATENTEIAYVVLSTQDLAGFGIAGETPTEQLTNYLSTIAGYGMLTEEFLGQFWCKGAPEEGMFKEASRYDAKESVQVYAVGFSAEDTGEIDPNWETPIFKINLLTPVHVWDVPFKPYPTVVVAEADMTKNVTSAAGEVVIDCVVENPMEGETVLCQTEATWVVPTWADNKLTLTYEANTAAVARRAKIAIQYGYYTNPFEITLVQEKDANAVATTLEVKVTGTTFNGIWVDVTPSDANALYALDTTTPEKNWETGAELPMDWATVGENLLSYVPGTTTFHKGELKGHFIKMNPSNYEWYGLDYYVYAVAVDATSEEGTDYFGNPETTWTVSGILSDVYYDRTTIDNSKTPSVVWDLTKNPELVWNATNERYDLEVVENSTVVLHFIVNNPADGAFLALNGNSLYDSFNVVDGEPVVDNAAGTVTIKIDKFDTSKNYHYVTPSFKYTNADGDTWGITTPGLRLTQVENPGMQLPYQESFADSIGNFTINNVDIDGLSYVWKHDAQYKQMKASAFVSNVKHATESWLESPKIDLSAASMPGLQFSHTHKYAGTPAEELTLWVKEWGAAEWTQVTIPTYGTNNDWTFVTAAVDLSAWAGKKVQIGFKYTSTTSAAATWEIKDVVVYDAGGVAM